MKADAQTAGEVQATVKKLTDAYEMRSLTEFMECFARPAQESSGK